LKGSRLKGGFAQKQDECQAAYNQEFGRDERKNPSFLSHERDEGDEIYAPAQTINAALFIDNA
jgi:hypothetical protein